MKYDLCLHVDLNDAALLALALKNARNYQNALPEETCELVIVGNGPSVTLFTAAQPALRETPRPLMDKGLKIRLCRNALNDNNLTEADLWPGIEVVPAGLVEIVRLQQAGFAYIKP